MENERTELFGGSYSSDLNQIDIQEFDTPGLLDGVFSILLSDILIAVIVIIICYFIFLKNDRITLKVGIISLLVYVTFLTILNLGTIEYQMTFTGYLINNFNLLNENLIYYLVFIASIRNIFINLIILLPIRYYLLHKQIVINYKKIFTLFFIYIIFFLYKFIMNVRVKILSYIFYFSGLGN